MTEAHHYRATVRWTGNRGSGTSGYTTYARDHLIEGAGKPPVPGSSDPHFRGDAHRYNPEELLVAILSACHMLWYLHLSAVAGLVVEAYSDEAEGVMETEADGSGHFTLVTLRPQVSLVGGSADRAGALHEEAHRKCFIANSVNFPVRCDPTTRIREA